MNHMRISGTESLSVILSQTKQFKKLKRDIIKASKEAEAKKKEMPCNKSTKLQFQ